ncbi:hypothetical protein VTK73DRAFT_1349 [Phialemonium thermophilum]|uniref:Uncharacterized protein n=1 Tax=Phialemonium thermophilum TaxID=223376 RepID=A0ABR3VTJ6_9PEZI
MPWSEIPNADRPFHGSCGVTRLCPVPGGDLPGRRLTRGTTYPGKPPTRETIHPVENPYCQHRRVSSPWQPLLPQPTRRTRKSLCISPQPTALAWNPTCPPATPSATATDRPLTLTTACPSPPSPSPPPWTPRCPSRPAPAPCCRGPPPRP